MTYLLGKRQYGCVRLMNTSKYQYNTNNMCLVGGICNNDIVASSKRKAYFQLHVEFVDEFVLSSGKTCGIS